MNAFPMPKEIQKGRSGYFIKNMKLSAGMEANTKAKQAG
jgi:hypothetical protein